VHVFIDFVIIWHSNEYFAYQSVSEAALPMLQDSAVLDTLPFKLGGVSIRSNYNLDSTDFLRRERSLEKFCSNVW
jgi:hypothetical protein